MKFTRKISRYYHPSHYTDPHVDFNFTTAYQSQTNGGGVGVSSFAMTTNKPPPLPIHINTHTYFHTDFQTRDRLMEGGQLEGGTPRFTRYSELSLVREVGGPESIRSGQWLLSNTISSGKGDKGPCVPLRLIFDR